MPLPPEPSCQSQISFPLLKTPFYFFSLGIFDFFFKCWQLISLFLKTQEWPNETCLQAELGSQTPALAFVAMDPFSLSPDYAPVLQPRELKDLGVQDSQELGFYVLCVVKRPVSDSTVNLKCPIAIHPDTRVARQVILESDAYEMRHPLAQFRTEEGAVC